MFTIGAHSEPTSGEMLPAYLSHNGSAGNISIQTSIRCTTIIVIVLRKGNKHNRGAEPGIKLVFIRFYQGGFTKPGVDQVESGRPILHPDPMAGAQILRSAVYHNDCFTLYYFPFPPLGKSIEAFYCIGCL